MVFMDHVAVHTTPEPTNAQNVTRSRLATFIRSFSTSAATLPLPLFHLTSLRVCAGAALLLFVLGGGGICLVNFIKRLTRWKYVDSSQSQSSRKGVAGLGSSQSWSPRKIRGRPKQSDDSSTKSRAYAACASARPPRDTPGKLPPLSTKGSNSGQQSSSSGTANAHEETKKPFGRRALQSWRKLFRVALRGHEALDERALPTPMVLFAYITDCATDPSTSPALSFKKRAYQTTNSETPHQPSPKKATALRISPLSTLAFLKV
jgi:hypothetical protein